MLELIILVLSTLVSASIGLFVFERNPRHVVNRIYGFLALLLTLFPLANYLSLHSSNQLFYIRVVVLISTLAVAALYYLAFFLGDSTKKLSDLQRFGVFYTAIVAVLTLTPFVFSGLGTGTNPAPVPAGGATLFFMQLVVFLFAASAVLVKHISTSIGHQRQQYFYMLVGILPMLVFAPITAFILPVVFQNVSLIFLSPLYVAFFVFIIGYAIIRHKLFDIRFFVVRSVAYLATIVVMATLFGVVVFGLSTLIFDWHLSLQVQIYLSLATSVAALAFSSLKSFFDSITNTLFYKDAYDSQALLDELNRLLVANTDMTKLLRLSANLIKRTLKAKSCVFVVYDPIDGHIRIVDVGLSLDEGAAREISELMRHVDSTVFVVDDLEHHQTSLDGRLRRYGIEAVGRLVTTNRSKATVMGYMLLGQRISGNPYNTKDTRVLEIVVNELTIAVENSLRFEQIQHFNETLQGKVDEATRKLRQTNEKLQGLDATKDEFITMASHQLRTPLTAVKGYLSMVLEGDAGKLNANQRRLLEQSYTSAQRMVYLIADLLNLSRLGTGKFVIEPTPTNLVDVVQTEIDQLAQTAASREVSLTFEHPDPFPEIMLDETKIHQVVMNFIDNAIYYTPPGGRVTVSLSETPGSIVYAVHDTGIGVPRREQRHLFTKFYRAENARQARPDGTGLGLFMAKKVVAAQGGAIIFESEESKGSTFGFRFNKRTHAVPGNSPTPKVQ